MPRKLLYTIAAVLPLTTFATAGADTVLPPINERFAAAEGEETPHFQRHIIPLFGRLGCNGRACHGSFQGRGGFRLSLFGYDFKSDHSALLDGRVEVDDPSSSLIIEKPTDADEHEGGLRYENGSWQHHVILSWIEGGAEFEKADTQKLVKLEMIPSEIVFKKKNETIQLRAVAHWEDGTQEDVTPLCRFKTNSGQVAKINETGLITSNEPGDTHIVVFYDNAVKPIPVMQPVTALTGNKYPKVATPTKVDELVIEKLRKLGVVPSDVCTDEEFLRRVSLDLAGTLPAPKEVKAFLDGKSPNKRAEKIEELLSSDAHAAWWTTKLCTTTSSCGTSCPSTIATHRRQAKRGTTGSTSALRKTFLTTN